MSVGEVLTWVGIVLGAWLIIAIVVSLGVVRFLSRQAEEERLEEDSRSFRSPV